MIILSYDRCPLILLTQCQFALVDPADYDELIKLRWCASWQPDVRSFYAYCNSIKTAMHRYILGLKFGDKRQGDHINHDTLDNRRENLRIVTNRQNSNNRRDQSRYGPGVYYRPDKNRIRPFHVVARINGVIRFVGCYSTAEEARQARVDFVKKFTSR